ncbi:MAG: ABC transporter permease [Candidatus Aminicenantia bacterium]
MRRIINSLVIIILVSSLGFFALFLLPGDPLEAKFGERIVHLKREKDSPFERYVKLLINFFKNGPGESLATGRKITEEIEEAIPYSILLTFSSVALSIAIAIPLGILSALKRKSIFDHILIVITVFFNSFPVISLGLFLIIVFSLWINFLPISGAEGVKSLFLPCFTLTLPFSAYLIRIIRKSLLLELKEGYILSLKARGIKERRILLNHCFRNSLFSLITAVNLRIGSLLSGAILTETLFAWPGIGRLLVRSISGRDYNLTFWIIIFISSSYVLLNLLTDIFYALLDPRVRLKYAQ